MTDEIERLRIAWRRAYDSKKRALERVNAIEESIDAAIGKLAKAETRHEKAYAALCDARREAQIKPTADT